jgi:hypothetical protein
MSQETILSGTVTKIIKVIEKDFFIQSEIDGNTSVIKIDRKTKTPKKLITVENTGLDIFMNDSLEIRYIRFLTDVNNRVYITYNPEGDKQDIQYARPEIYPELAFPKDMDEHNNVYCTNGFSMTSITPDLDLKWKLSISNILINKDNLLLSRYDENTKNLVVYQWALGQLENTNYVSLDIKDIRLARLIGITESSDLVIETHIGSQKLTFLFDKKTRKLKELPPKVIFKNNTLQQAKYWQVDEKGNIYMPVASDDGLHFIKILTE